MKSLESELVEVWKALGDPTRRQILDLLRRGPVNTTAVCDSIDHLSRHGVIKHLKTLQTAGLVTVETRGRERINRLNPVPLQQIHERWMKPYEELWSSRILRLTKTAEHGATPEGIAAMEPSMAVRQVHISVSHHSRVDREVVWSVLVDHFDEWWFESTDEHSGSVSLDASVGGLLWDDRGGGNGFTYGIVRGVDAPTELILEGTFGMEGALAGSASIRLEEADAGGTDVTITHDAVGAIPEGGQGNQVDGWTQLSARICAAADNK
ncbi:MAG: metalloregulator ArsR/SmtB family transcription factor [Acidimicrobiales bacterium]